MTLEFFKDIANQCTDFGYKNFGLTPVTGDVFMDKNILDKFDYLENLKKLEILFLYKLYTINEKKIERLFSYKKLTHLGISIYGHDEASFINFSRYIKFV